MDIVYNIFQAYILYGVFVAVYCYLKTNKIKVPIFSYLIIILIWPYQLYLQGYYKNK